MRLGRTKLRGLSFEVSSSERMPELRDLIGLAEPYAERLVWYVLDLDYAGTGSTSGMADRVRDSEKPVRLEGDELRRLAQDVLQTWDCNMAAFAKSLNPLECAQLQTNGLRVLQPSIAFVCYDQDAWDVVGPPGFIEILMATFPGGRAVPAKVLLERM